MKWKRSNLIIFILGSIFHLLFLLFQFYTLDWKIQWYSSREIISGIPFYEQTTRIVEGETIWYSNHFPIFFYAMALWMNVFGTSQIVARLFLWISTIFMGLLLAEIDEYDEKSRNVVLVLFFLNPLTIIINLLALFDIFMMIYFMLGLYFGSKNRYLISSVSLIFGVYTKLIPIFGIYVISLWLIRNRKYIEFLLYGFLTTFVLGAVYYIFFKVYGNVFLQKTIKFQFTRNNVNASLWYAFFGFDIDPSFLFNIQIVIISIVSLSLFFYPLEENDLNIYTASALLVTTFMILLRTSYGHYGIWFSILLIPVMTDLFRQKNYKMLGFSILSILIYTMGNILCLISCYDSEEPILWITKLEAIFFAIGSLMIICFCYFYGFREKIGSTLSKLKTRKSRE